ncbi:hypothetical protein V8G54_029502 [Vigna mungo]|uniref:Uncharacterized protein n=1 Tax=Vigna mungo TaxID=3915 RepID=A0AAQ3MUE5_VIGMU
MAEEVVTKEKFERIKSVLEADLRDIQERYFHMSLKYAEVEAEREELVMKLKATKTKKGQRIDNHQLCKEVQHLHRSPQSPHVFAFGITPKGLLPMEYYGSPPPMIHLAICHRPPARASPYHGRTYSSEPGHHTLTICYNTTVGSI